eukprot:1501090-Prymnesium_polylepis.2
MSATRTCSTASLQLSARAATTPTAGETNPASNRAPCAEAISPHAPTSIAMCHSSLVRTRRARLARGLGRRRSGTPSSRIPGIAVPVRSERSRARAAFAASRSCASRDSAASRSACATANARSRSSCWLRCAFAAASSASCISTTRGGTASVSTTGDDT